MRGVYGQAIHVDPELKLVLVHTAVAKTATIGNEPMGAELGALWLVTLPLAGCNDQRVRHPPPAGQR